MPELPDLEAFSGNLNKAFEGKVLTTVTVVNKSKLKVPEKELKQAIEGQRLTKIYREGKELHFAFTNKHVLGLHLMLNGNLNVFEEANPKKNTIIELLFDDQSGLAMTDFQGMATPSLDPPPRTAPDALSDELNFTYLQQKLQTKTAIKKLLLDQKIIGGIGNAYADEILWDARISPFSHSNKIPPDKIKALIKSIKHVLKDAIKHIKQTHPDIITGEIRDFLQIHNSKKTHSPSGAEIKTALINSRKTYYTNEQELYE